MKPKFLILPLMAAATLPLAAFAQDAAPSPAGPTAQEPGPGGPGHRPVPPIIAALDTDKDGVISASEIANAPASLKTLDKNNDGQLTRDELRPPKPPKGGPGGGPDAKGPQGPPPAQ